MLPTRSWCAALLLAAAVWGPARSAPAVASPPEEERAVVVAAEDSAELVVKKGEVTSEVEKAASASEAGEAGLPAARELFNSRDTTSDAGEIIASSAPAKVDGSDSFLASARALEASPSVDTTDSAPVVNQTGAVLSAGDKEDTLDSDGSIVASSRQARLLGFDTSKLFSLPSWLKGLMGDDDHHDSAAWNTLRRPGFQKRRGPPGPLRRQGLRRPQGHREPLRAQGPPAQGLPPRRQVPLRAGPGGGPIRRGPDAAPSVLHGFEPPRTHPARLYHELPQTDRHIHHPVQSQEVHHVHHHTHVHVRPPETEGGRAGGVITVQPDQGTRPIIRPAGVPRRPEDHSGPSSAAGPWRWGGQPAGAGSATFSRPLGDRSPTASAPLGPEKPHVKPCNACGGTWIPCDDCDTRWAWQSTGDVIGGDIGPPTSPDVQFPAPGPGRAPSRPELVAPLFEEEYHRPDVLFPGESRPDELATEASVISSVIAEETPVRPVVFVAEAPRRSVVTVTTRVPAGLEVVTTEVPVRPAVEQVQPHFVPRPPLQSGSLVTESSARQNEITTEKTTRKPETTKPSTEPLAIITEAPGSDLLTKRPVRPPQREATTQRPRRRPTARPSIFQRRTTRRPSSSVASPAGPFRPSKFHPGAQHLPEKITTTATTTTTTTATTTTSPTTTTTTTTTPTTKTTTTRPPTTTTEPPPPPPTPSFPERLPGLDRIPIV